MLTITVSLALLCCVLLHLWLWERRDCRYYERRYLHYERLYHQRLRGPASEEERQRLHERAMQHLVVRG